MSRSIIVLTGLLAASIAAAAEPVAPAPPPASANAPTRGAPVASIGGTGAVQVGDAAPAFSYIGADGAWHGFRQLFARGAVLLVFGARERDLAALEAARPVLDELGVQPVIVVDMSPGSASRFARRLGVHAQVISDPRRAIAELYGTLDATTRRHAPAYFVLDPRGTIRGQRRGSLPPPRHMVSVAANSLGRPLPESARELSQRR